MLSPDIEVTSQIEDARYNRDRSVTRYVRVEFFVGKHGPFRVEVPVEAVQNGERDTYIENYARNVRVT